MNIMYSVLLSTVMMYISFSNAAFSASGSFELNKQDFEETIIVIPEDADSAKQFAAQEMQKHLRLITGHEFPITDSAGNAKKIFYVGIKPDSDTKPLENEEARYVIGDDSVYLYGEDIINWKSSSVMKEILGSWPNYLNRLGTLYAVYNFL